MTILQESERVYSSGYLGRVRTLFGGLFGTAITAIIVPKLFLDEWMRIHDQKILVGCLVLILVVGTGMTLSRVFLTGPVRIITTPSKVEVHRGGRLRGSWPRATTDFSSFVLRTTTNGVPSGTTRKVIATTATERVETVCTWFSPADFNALVADISPVLPSYTAPGGGEAAQVGYRAAPTAAPAAATSGHYAIDHSRLRRGRTIAIVTLTVFFVLAISIGYISLVTHDRTTFELIVIAGIVVLVLAGPVVLVRSLRQRGIPYSIWVSPSTLQFDNHTFSVADFSSITATPPSYTTGMRSIILIGNSGQRTKIPLGGADHSQKATAPFTDYDDFVRTLALATAYRPGLFTLNVA